MKKIAVCGKGGNGKSTVVALVARELCARSGGVVVVDSDESNAGLYHMLGFDHPPVPLLELAGGKKKVQKLMRSSPAAGDQERTTSVLQQDQIRLDEIPDRHVLRRSRLVLVAIGKIHQALEGCACPMGVLSREFLKRLKLASDEVALVDMEAGVEHFGRGVETSLDTVLALVEPSLESILLAARIKDLATGCDVHFAGAVMNRIPDNSIRERLASELRARQLPVLGIIGHHPEIAEAGLVGELPGEGTWTGEISAVVDALMTRGQ